MNRQLGESGKTDGTRSGLRMIHSNRAPFSYRVEQGEGDRRLRRLHGPRPRDTTITSQNSATNGAKLLV